MLQGTEALPDFFWYSPDGTTKIKIDRMREKMKKIRYSIQDQKK